MQLRLLLLRSPPFPSPPSPHPRHHHRHHSRIRALLPGGAIWFPVTGIGVPDRSGLRPIHPPIRTLFRSPTAFLPPMIHFASTCNVSSSIIDHFRRRHDQPWSRFVIVEALVLFEFVHVWEVVRCVEVLFGKGYCTPSMMTIPREFACYMEAIRNVLVDAVEPPLCGLLFLVGSHFVDTAASYHYVLVADSSTLPAAVCLAFPGITSPSSFDHLPVCCPEVEAAIILVELAGGDGYAESGLATVAELGILGALMLMDMEIQFHVVDCSFRFDEMTGFEMLHAGVACGSCCGFDVMLELPGSRYMFVEVRMLFEAGFGWEVGRSVVVQFGKMFCLPTRMMILLAFVLRSEFWLPGVDCAYVAGMHVPLVRVLMVMGVGSGLLVVVDVGVQSDGAALWHVAGSLMGMYRFGETRDVADVGDGDVHVALGEWSDGADLWPAAGLLLEKYCSGEAWGVADVGDGVDWLLAGVVRADVSVLVFLGRGCRRRGGVGGCYPDFRPFSPVGSPLVQVWMW